jgi:zona occludens toxin (predicted ATPase)
MSYKSRLLIFALALFLLCDAAAWYATYRVVASIVPAAAEADTGVFVEAAEAASEQAENGLSEEVVPEARSSLPQVLVMAAGISTALVMGYRMLLQYRRQKVSRNG